MKFVETVDLFTVELFEDDTFTENSTDNKYSYMHIYRFDDSNYIISRHAILIYKDSKLISNAILLGAGGGTTVHEHSYIIDNEHILICAGSFILSLDIPNLEILWKTKVDDATAFQIFKMKSDYIVHGELSISRIDYYGKIIWQQYGSDIFITADGRKNDFRIKENKIYAESWDERKYIIEYDGTYTSQLNK